MSHPKFEKKYNEITIDKTISFFYKRFSKKETSTICDVVKDMIQTNCTERQKNGIVLHLNDFIKWFSKYYEKLPDNDFRSVYLKSVSIMWRERNNAKWDVLKLETAVRTHLSNLFAALFRSERNRLFSKESHIGSIIENMTVVDKVCKCYCDEICHRRLAGLCCHKHDETGHLKKDFKYNECRELKMIIDSTK